MLKGHRYSVSRLPHFTVLYDGGCPLCRRTVRLLAQLDWFGRLTFADATDDALRMRLAPGLSREDALSEMYVVSEDGSRIAGFDGYLRLSQGLPTLWVFRWSGLLSPFTALGRRVYRRVAARRTRRGPCTDDVCAPSPAPAMFPWRALRASLAATALLTVVGAGLERLEVVSFAQLNVRWQSSVPEPARRAAARRYSMYFLRNDDDVVQYALADSSRENIAALRRVDGARVDLLDSAGIPTEIRHVTVRRWVTIRYGVDLESVLSPVSVAPLTLLCVFVGLLMHSGGRAWLGERVPSADPVAMSLFRVALAGALFLAIRSRAHTTGELLLQGGLLLGFGSGVLPRTCFAFFIATFAWLNPVGDHDVNLPFKTWCLLLAVPWGDAPGVLSLWRHRPNETLRPETSRRYGLAFWIPMLTLGVAYLGAAYAKVAVSGLQWMTGGAIRYFVAVDGHNAPGSLWKFVAAHDVVAVALSSAAVATESAIVLAALWYSPLLAAAAGLGALGMHSGFWLLQGVWWPLWWALLPAFLPWTVIAKAFSRPAIPMSSWRIPTTETTGALAATVLVLFTGSQIVAYLLQLERPPILSNFPMYSDVQWSSKAEFAAERDQIRSGLPIVRVRLPSASGPAGASECITDDERIAKDVRDRTQPDGDAWDGLIACAVTSALAEGLQSAEVAAVEVAPSRFDWRYVGFVAAGPWQQAGVLTLSDSRIAW